MKNNFLTPSREKLKIESKYETEKKVKYEHDKSTKNPLKHFKLKTSHWK